MHHVSQLLTRLDSETRSQHASADEGWRLMLNDTVRRADYVRQLVLTYGFEAPYESACAYTPGLVQVIELRGRWRAGLLAQDLLALDLSAERLTSLRCAYVAPFYDAAEALAWMYVVERATLMHSLVRAHLVSKMPELAQACAYLRAYDGLASVRWQQLGRALDQVATTSAVIDRMIKAAQAALAAHHEWREVCDRQLRIA